MNILYHHSKTFGADPERQYLQGICHQDGCIGNIVEKEKEKYKRNSCLCSGNIIQSIV